MKILNRTTNQTFCGASHTDLLSAALEAGQAVRHACRRGMCGACKARVVSGEYATGADHANAVTAAPAEVLLCQTFAHTDMVLEFEPGNDEFSRPHSARIENVRYVTPDVAIVSLGLLSNPLPPARAGQFIALRWYGERQKLFSIANAETHQRLELHIRRVPGGEFTDWLFQTPAIGTLLGFDGPYGEFHWQSQPGTPVLLLATGTGLAPIKALMERHLATHNQAPVYLYWGGRSASDLYLATEVANWSRLNPQFHYRPVLLNSERGLPVNGRCGDLLRTILADFPSLAGFDVYACGAPALISAARVEFSQTRGHNTRRFFADPFVAASPPPSGEAIQAIPITVTRGSLELGVAQAEPGVSVLELLTRAGIHLPHACGGNAACGSCLVEISGPHVSRSEIQRDEADLLECLPEIGPNHRLGCQTRISAQFAGATLTLNPDRQGH